MIARVLLIASVLALATGCSKYDKHKEAFMGQCMKAKSMETVCSCIYDRMTAEIPVEKLAYAMEIQQDQKAAKAIASAMTSCVAEHRP